MDPKRVLQFAVDEQVKFVDIRFTDLPGGWHHVTVPINQFNEDSFDSGIGFDASSLRGWASINESVATFEAMGIDPERGEFPVIVS